MSDNGKQAQAGNFVLVLVAMVVGVLTGLMFSSQSRKAEAGTLQGKVGQVMEMLETQYVDPVDADSVGGRLLQAMLSELDPHSIYMSAQATEAANESMRGRFDGVGIVLHREGDTTFVGQVMPDGPSANIGIMPGDKILAVDGVPVTGMPADSVVSRLRGPRRSMVDVVVERLVKVTRVDTLRFAIRRGVVPLHTVDHSTMIDDKTGYISISSFAETTYDEFRSALWPLMESGMRQLVLDLRGNGGGSLQSAVGIAGELLPKGSLIVYTEGVHSRRHDVRTSGDGMFTDGRVVVLVDENSASASEVVSGALQDNDRATIVGRRTFGKGLVQTELSLGDGSAVLLTTARYYTPSGRCIQRSYKGGIEEYYRDYYNQLMDEAYADSMTVAILDSTPYYTVGGRTVYGGGGIAPDVPLGYRKDVSFVYYNALVSGGLLNNVAFGHVRRHAAELLARYPDADAFVKGYKASEALVNELVERGEAAGVKRNDASLRVQRGLIETMLKANIGMALYGNAAYRNTYMGSDDDLQRTLSLLKQKEKV